VNLILRKNKKNNNMNMKMKAFWEKTKKKVLINWDNKILLKHFFILNKNKYFKVLEQEVLNLTLKILKQIFH
jgi:hypothetical protein